MNHPLEKQVIPDQLASPKIITREQLLQYGAVDGESARDRKAHGSYMSELARLAKQMNQMH